MGNKGNLRILGNSGENGKEGETGKIENRGYFGKVVYLGNWYSWENREFR